VPYRIDLRSAGEGAEVKTLIRLGLKELAK